MMINNSTYSPDKYKLFSKKSLRSMLLALLFSISLFSILPFFDAISSQNTKTLLTRTAPNIIKSQKTLKTVSFPEDAPSLNKQSNTKLLPLKTITHTPKIITQKEVIKLNINILKPSISSDDFSIAFSTANIKTKVKSNKPKVARKVKSQYAILDLDSIPSVKNEITPIYPHNARLREIEGFVKISFIISKDGKIKNIRVIDSEPSGIFEKAVLSTVKRWQFTKPTVHGIPVRAKSTRKFKFRLEKR